MSQNLTGDDITANVLIGAALMGAKDGVIESLTSKTEETRSLAANLIEPGDQRHIPHPWEDFKNSVKRTISLATTPGDMNPSHSPHPINATAQAHDASVKMATRMLEEKGVVEGIRTISAMAAAIAVDNADPFKKLQMVNKITEIPATADPNFRIDDVQKIANMLFPDEEGTDVIWTATPRSLFLGIVLMLAETPEKPLTLGQVVRETLNDGDGAKYFAKLINERAAAGSPYSGTCVRALNSYVSIAAENTRAGVITSFRSRLELWINPLVDAATSANDFDLREVRKKRMSIYLGVTPDNLERMAPLLNLFFQQLIDLNTRELPSQNDALKYSCVLLMDEFTSIGKVGVLSKGISYIAGYNLRMLPIIQSPKQLVEVYGEDVAQTFTTNHALNIIFPPKASETQTAKDISEWLGNQTVKSVSKSRSTNVFKSEGNTNSTSEQSRALMLPQEITSLGEGKELVIVENIRPILAEKVVYFKDPEFIRRLKAVSKSLRALGGKTPTRKQMDEAIRKGELAAKVPLLDIEAHNRLNASEEITMLSAPKGAAPALKPLDQVDFSSVKKPPPGEMDEAALKAYADDLCRAMGMNV